MERSANCEWGPCASRRCIYHVPLALRPRSHSHFFAPLSSPNSAIASRSDPGSFSAAEFCHSLFPPTRLSSPVPSRVCPTVGLAPPLPCPVPSPPPVQFHTCKCNFLGQDHARRRGRADADADDGNGIIPLNDCPSTRRVCPLSPFALAPCALSPRRAAPGQFWHFDSSLLSSVRTENEVADRASHRSLERTDQVRARCKLLCGIERLHGGPEVILRVAREFQRICISIC